MIQVVGLHGTLSIFAMFRVSLRRCPMRSEAKCASSTTWTLCIQGHWLARAVHMAVWIDVMTPPSDVLMSFVRPNN